MTRPPTRGYFGLSLLKHMEEKQVVVKFSKYMYLKSSDKNRDLGGFKSIKQIQMNFYTN